MIACYLMKFFKINCQGALRVATAIPVVTTESEQLQKSAKKMPFFSFEKP
jgi:hypothetical protein